MQHNCLYPNPSIAIKCIRFITKFINLIYLLKILPYHPPETINKVSTTERNIIHNMTKQINNIIMGITSTCRNTAYPRTRTNSYMVPHLQGYQLYHLIMIVSCLQVLQNERNGTHLTWPRHNPPSQQESSIIPDEHHTAPTIWSPMFIG